MAHTTNATSAARASDVSASTRAMPVGRLAPTPSGSLHVGNLFSAMLAWLIVRKAGGRLLLRIEDLDAQRCKRSFAEQIMRDYEKLGITWDNAEVIYQSERSEAYEAALALLQEKGLVYPCFCSRADLHSANAPHRGERYLYAGTCRSLSGEEQAERALKRPAAQRLHVPAMRLSFDDGLQGPFSQDLAGECGDFIIRRSDGVFAYQLAVVVDDIEQGVTQVVRGIDLIDSSPQQLYLKSLLAPSYPNWDYYHVPLMLDAAGERLSKRNGAQSLAGILEHFASVEAFIGYLAGSCGLAETKEPVSLDELLKVFSLESLRGVRELRWKLPEA